MFRQVCLLALLAVVVVFGRREPQPRYGDAARLRGLLPPYALKKMFGERGGIIGHLVNTTSIIIDSACTDVLNLPKLGCKIPKYVEVTVHDWEPVADIVVPKPRDYTHIDLHRTQPCVGESLVEIFATCYDPKY